MSLSRYTAMSARVLGTSAAAAALAIGAAHTALACSIGDFSAAAVCDADGNGVIRVTDKDVSGTPATVSLYVELNTPGQERLVDTRTIEPPTAQGTTVDLVPLDWYAGETFRVHVKAGDQVDDDIQPEVVVAEETCAPSGSSSAPATPSGQPSAASSTTPTTQPSPAQSGSSSSVPSVSSAPSAAGGGADLAETGAGTGTTMIAGAATALIVAGGGIVVTLRRRTAHRSH
ncbi:LAETG motif-containing sortase-dependent surface protein [Streptomyces sp. NPDC048385]|uniref:LAETG motif-containing sortase-dependent surface protein n=1 Tax=unclassified Streptomyces TaxID=2593676 RepID=UPI00342179A8